MIFLLLIALATQATTPDAMQHVQAGLEARQQHQVDVEITEFREATRIDPGLAAAFLNLGTAYMEKHDYGAAIVPLKRALELSPDLLAAHQFLGYALLAQSYSIWKLRQTMNWRKVMPFLIGGIVGVPLGTMLLAYINPAHLRVGVGVLLVLYSIYSLAKPALKPVQGGGVPADLGIGFFNGLLGGLTGLGGVIVTVWVQLRGWPKDVQRIVFQPVILAAQAMTAFSLAFGQG